MMDIILDGLYENIKKEIPQMISYIKYILEPALTLKN